MPYYDNEDLQLAGAALLFLGVFVVIVVKVCTTH
jgi:hypothetical protein